jgi:hypothetical protein
MPIICSEEDFHFHFKVDILIYLSDFADGYTHSLNGP